MRLVCLPILTLPPFGESQICFGTKVSLSGWRWRAGKVVLVGTAEGDEVPLAMLAAETEGPPLESGEAVGTWTMCWERGDWVVTAVVGPDDMAPPYVAGAPPSLLFATNDAAVTTSLSRPHSCAASSGRAHLWVRDGCLVRRCRLLPLSRLRRCPRWPCC